MASPRVTGLRFARRAAHKTLRGQDEDRLTRMEPQVENHGEGVMNRHHQAMSTFSTIPTQAQQDQKINHIKVCVSPRSLVYDSATSNDRYLHILEDPLDIVDNVNIHFETLCKKDQTITYIDT